MVSIRFQLSYNAKLNWLVNTSRVIDNVNTRVVPHYKVHLNYITSNKSISMKKIGTLYK